MNYIANEIYRQLGGNKFTVMTGAKDFVPVENGLRFRIGRNASKANMVMITLNALDTYDVKFIKHTPAKLVVNHRKATAEWREEKTETVKAYTDFDGIYNDMLQDVFTMVTGLYTRL